MNTNNLIKTNIYKQALKHMAVVDAIGNGVFTDLELVMMTFQLSFLFFFFFFADNAKFF